MKFARLQLHDKSSGWVKEMFFASVNKKRKLLIVLPAIIVCCGCQSGFFQKPDFGKLAFWKNSETRLAKNDIPPPSVHFSPDDVEPEKMNPNEKLKKSIDKMLAEAESTKSSGEPIRKPYSLDSIDSKIGGEKTSIANRSATDVFSQKLNQFQATTNQLLNSTENAVKQTNDLIAGTANTVGGLKNSLQNATESQVGNVSQQIKSQTGQLVKNTTTAVNQFAANTGDSINQTISTVKNSLDNSFATGSIDNANSGMTAQAKAETLADSKSSAPPNNNDFLPVATQKHSKPADLPSGSSGKSIPGSVISAETMGPTQSVATMTATPVSGNGSATSVSDSRSAGLGPVQQSGFSSPAGNSTAVLRPIENVGASVTSPAPKYPTTSFGVIKSNGPKSDESDGDDEFEIPQHLLRGAGSFTPGSTRPLRPIR